MTPKLLYLVAGARPNFMKLAPLVRALDERRDALAYRIVHTGQHYDREMSDVFFDELGIPKPDHHLGAGGGTHAEQTAKVMVAFEALCVGTRPDAVVVVGDVNSTLACSIVAKKLGIGVAHVEAGLRSGDIAMPEEINRLVTDAISDWFFVTEPSGVEHLRHEGKPDERVHYVGHVMVDNVLYQRDLLAKMQAGSGSVSVFKAAHPRYGVVTLHRPSNVDDPAVFGRIAGALREVSEQLALVFPVHPRTRANMQRHGIDLGSRVQLVPPLAYMAFLDLWKDAALVLTDSGGLQEETTALGIPCLTLRENTERPVTVTDGTNVLVGSDPVRIRDEVARILAGQGKQGRRPHLWDGQAARRIVEILVRVLH
ncbi:MAG: UDP-N-acetylglucosamine 2-epimerase (non-hydrolyzing) [Burkholderiaceae bacterium]